MYYHNSPTVQQIKALKSARAVEMRIQLLAMKTISKRYDPLIKQLEKLRTQELLVENEMTTGRLSDAQLARYMDTIASNRRKAVRLVTKLTGVNDTKS